MKKKKYIYISEKNKLRYIKNNIKKCQKINKTRIWENISKKYVK